MRLLVVDDYDALNLAAADLIVAAVAAHPTATVVPATGVTPKGASASSNSTPTWTSRRTTGAPCTAG